MLVAVNFDTRFTFVYPGWEGSVHDSRVLTHAIEKDHIKCPEGNNPVLDVSNMIMYPFNYKIFHVMLGKYYMADVEYATRTGFIMSYRGERYHLNDYLVNHNPTNCRKLFNHRHSSLRMSVERAFSLLTGCFKILTGTPTFPYKTQVAIVHACCLLHNSILDSGGDELMLPKEAWVSHNRRNVGLEDRDIAEVNNTWVQKKGTNSRKMCADYN